MKVLEDYMEMGKMVAKQLTEHQDIIQVYNHEVVKKDKKHLIHQILKSRGGQLDNPKGITTHSKRPKCTKNIDCMVSALAYSVISDTPGPSPSLRTS